MRYRKLRIAGSVGCSIACVLLIALWVRSYWRFDEIIWTGEAGTFAVYTDQGKLTIETMNERVFLPLGWSRANFSISDDDSISDDESKTLLGFGWQTENGSITADVPFWFLALTCAAVAGFTAAPWLPWWSKRFSLRTLFIATTLVAVVLGLIVYLSNRSASPPLDVGDFDDATESSFSH